MDTNNTVSLFELQVDHESTIYLRESAKWARFLATLGFVWCGILILIGLSILATRTKAYSGSDLGIGYTVGLSAGYMIIAVINFFPCLYTNNFARRMRTALQNNDQEQLNSSLKSLKAVMRYLGITAIVGLALLVVVILFNLFG
ncbi:MAG TPA: hypothetical protein VHD83_25020 [Puia sp.]|nr:hypothetical protein [Puia sp.]